MYIYIQIYNICVCVRVYVYACVVIEYLPKIKYIIYVCVCMCRYIDYRCRTNFRDVVPSIVRLNLEDVAQLQQAACPPGMR
jgi:hypothetical protein